MSTGHTVPKSMTRVKEEFQGYPLKYIAAVSITAIFCLILSLALLGSSNKIPILLMLFGVIAFFFKFLRTNAVMNRSWLWYQYFLRSLRGQTIIPKYKVSAAFMQSVVPIKEFHPGGLIEFSGGKYGMILKADPSRISDDDLENHLNRVRALTDSLHGGLSLKSFVVSMSDSGRIAERGMLKLLNERGRSKAEQDHLYSLYSESVENRVPVIQWKFYLGLYFGRYTNLQEAEISKAQYFPGAVDRMNKAGMHVIPVTDPVELGRTFRELVAQVQT